MKNRCLTVSMAAAVLCAAGMAQAQSYTESFDDINVLPGNGWFNQNNSIPGLTSWFQGNTGVFGPQATAGYLGANYNNTTGLNTISNWMVTPVRQLADGQSFKFWTRTVDAPAFADRLQVRMSLAGASTNVGVLPEDVGDFTTLLLDINPTYTPASYPSVWTQYEIVLSGIGAPTDGRLAFRYFVENGGPSGTNSDYIGIDEVEYIAGAVTTGACCLSDGSCVVTTASTCQAQNGIYRGDNSPCATANCPQPLTGACCFFDGSCQILTQAQCTGTYRGDGTDCQTANCPAVPPVVYSNCGFTTGPTTLSGVAAPANSLWSECARDENDPTTANTTAGFAVSGAFRLADDFVVPTGGMNVAYIKVYAYSTGATVPGVTAATLQILDGSPALGGNVVFGDQTTNRLASTGFTDIYRTFNTVTPPTCGGAVTAPGTTRRVQEIYIAVNQFLPAGTYWLDYNVTGAAFAPTATQSDAIGRQCDPNNSNGLQFNAAWVDANDAGQGCAPVPVQQDFPFEVLGTTGSTCYPNCDGSTVQPILNVSDFICFQTKYAANDPYANCDGSTVIPVLNVSDFICFQTMYAAGCS